MYIGKRAEQDINGFMSIVIIRLERLSIAREERIAGTLQPKPIIKGMNDLPCRPMRCITLSIINAARAIYPVSSRNEMHRYNINIFGKNTMTPPTPPMIPLATRSLMGPSGMVLWTKLESASTPALIQSIGNCPSENVSQKMKNIMSKNSGYPNILLVNRVSSRRVVSSSLSSSRVRVSASAPAIYPYFSAAISAGTSSLNLSLRSTTNWSRSSISRSPCMDLRTISSVSLSPSSNFMAIYRGENLWPISPSALMRSLSTVTARSISLPRLTCTCRTSILFPS